MGTGRKHLILSMKQGFQEARAYELNLEGQVALRVGSQRAGYQFGVCWEQEGGRWRPGDRGGMAEAGKSHGQRREGRIMDSMPSQRVMCQEQGHRNDITCV